jgi:hypothetical protein
MHGLPVGPPEIPCLRLMGFPQVAQEPSGAAPPEPGCLFDGSTGPRDLVGHPSLGSLVVLPRRLGLSGFGATLIHRIALRTTPDKPDHKSAEREPDSGNERQRFRTQHEARLGRVGPTHGPALHQIRARRGRQAARSSLPRATGSSPRPGDRSATRGPRRMPATKSPRARTTRMAPSSIVVRRLGPNIVR